MPAQAPKEQEIGVVAPEAEGVNLAVAEVPAEAIRVEGLSTAMRTSGVFDSFSL